MPSRTLEGLALEQTEKFLKPRTFLDMVYLFFLIFWLVTAFIFTNDAIFRATMFGIIIILFIVTPIYVNLSEGHKAAASSKNRAFKVLLFYIFINILTPNSNIPTLWNPSVFPVSYKVLESIIVCLLVPIGILVSRLQPKNLDYGYSYYIQNFVKSLCFSYIIVFILKGINLLIPPSEIVVDFDKLLLITYSLYLLINILPSVSKPIITSEKVNLSVDNLFNQYQALKSRNERVRDTLFFSSLCLLGFLWLNWIEMYGDVFRFIAVVGLFLWFVLLFAPSKEKGAGFSSVVNSLTGHTIDPSSVVGGRVQNFMKSIQETEFEKPERVYSIPTDGMKLISKGKMTVSAAKGSLAIPTVTDKGTALVLMGKSEMETETEDQQTTKEEIEGTTTLWIPPEEWDKIKLKLDSKDVNDLSEVDLKQAGIEKASEIYDKTKNALENLKSWKGPQDMFSSVFDETPSKYSVKETEDYSIINIPGVYVLETKFLEIINVFGGFVKVLKIKGVGEYIQIGGGFVTVMETPDYSFVQGPFFSTIETPEGEKVRVFGIDFNEGKEIDLVALKERVMSDSSNFENLLTKRVEKIFEEDPQLIFTDSMGEKRGFLFGEDEILGDIKPTSKESRTLKKKKRIGIVDRDGTESIKGFEKFKKREKREKRESRHHKRFDTSITVNANQPQEQEDQIETIDLDPEGIPINHPELQRIEVKFERMEESIDEADDRLLEGILSENKHTELVTRLKERQTKLLEEKEKVKDKLKVKLV